MFLLLWQLQQQNASTHASAPGQIHWGPGPSAWLHFSNEVAKPSKTYSGFVRFVVFPTYGALNLLEVGGLGPRLLGLAEAVQT